MKRLFEIGSKITIRTDLKTGMSIKFGVNEEMEKLAEIKIKRLKERLENIKNGF